MGWRSTRRRNCQPKICDVTLILVMARSSARFCIWPARDEAWSLWTTESCADLAALNERWREVIDRRAHFLSSVDESRLAAEMPFKLLSGDPSSLPLADQMQHVANHATLHRGQVVGMIRQLGLEPPSTDLLFYLRREISPK